MKKQFMILVAGLVLAVALAACTPAGAPEAPSTDPSQTTSPSQSETTDPTQGSGSTGSSEPDTKFQELTLVEDANCTVKVTAVQAERTAALPSRCFWRTRQTRS